jgi:hypothetical protein
MLTMVDVSEFFLKKDEDNDGVMNVMLKMMNKSEEEDEERSKG